MRFRDLLIEVFALCFRFLPWKGPTGLLAVGDPGSDSPVLLTGNYRLTVSRVRRALRGADIWLLVADSHGINVWCAASGGHLTNAGVVEALKTSGIEGKVEHRRLILPQLSATGLEPRVIERNSGWDAVFGPVRAEDLPAFLERGRTTREMRTIAFPPARRLEVGAFWGIPIVVVILAAGWPLFGILGASAGAVAALLVTLGVCIVLPWVPAVGWRRVWTALGMAAAFLIIAGGVWSISRPISGPALAIFGLVGLLLGGIVTADLAGTTPVLGSGIFHTDRFIIEPVVDRCRKTSECIVVCPRNVLAVSGGRVDVARAEYCIRCGACIVQCPEDALQFRYDDGSTVGALAVRGYKLGLFGRRSVPVPDL